MRFRIFYVLEDVTSEAIPEAMRESVMAELRKSFRPEFLNRIDETILFKPLTLEEITTIVDLLLTDLNNVVVDHVRSRTAATRRDDAWMNDTITLADDADAQRQICGCFEKLLPSLKPIHAELLRRVELQEQPASKAAIALGITTNNASVTLHRARAELRAKLVDFCGNCACLDHCECE